MTVEKQKPKQLLRPITTGASSAINQSQFRAITCNLLTEREKSRVHDAIGFGFTSHWLKNWRESFKPIIKHSNRNHVIAFESHLKTALIANKTKGEIKKRTMDIHNKRLKHERAINKYTGNLQGKNTAANFITNVIYYITKKVQFNFILKVSSPQTESLREDNHMILKSSQSWMCPWSLLGCLHFVPKEPLLCTKFFFFHLQCFILLSTKPVLYQYNILIIACM